MKENIVVVGGGIAGIFSALLYSNKGFKVTLLEKENEIGGLLRSQKLFDEELPFDYGTHFLRQTGNKEIDSLLFKNLDVTLYDYIKAGSFYKELYDKNGFLSDKKIEDKEEALSALKLKEPRKEYFNLAEQLKAEFGIEYAKILSKIVTKYFFEDPIELIQNSHELFGLGRIVVGTNEETQELKKNPKFDNVIAFHSYKDGISSLKSMYPTQNGAGSWIEAMEQALIENDVKIIKGANLGQVVKRDGKIESIQFNDEIHQLDKLVWTIPPFILLKKLGIKLETEPPSLLTSCIFHYLVDEKYLTDLYYFQCFDPDLKSFRITLYDNYSSGVKDKYRISVEVLLKDYDVDVGQLSGEIFQELVAMKVISSNAKKLNEAYNIYPNGFPVLNHSFMAKSEKQYKTLKESYKNIELFGKAKGNLWFMNDIILDIYNSINIS